MSSLMNIIVFAFLMLTMFSCMEGQFGYKQNPINVIALAQKAIHTNKLNVLKNFLTKEALCVYGNQNALLHLKKEILPKANQYDLEASLLVSKYLKHAKFVGYWSYYTEEYQLSLTNKESKILEAEIMIICEFGFQGVKSEEDLDRPVNEYDMKSCRIQKFIGHQLEELPKPQNCNQFNVTPLK